MADADLTAPPPTSRRGLVYGLTAHSLWGLFPLYFKAVEVVPALEILVHRIVWSLALLIPLVLIQRQWSEVRRVLRDRGTLGVLLVTTTLIALNWYLFIVAVETDRVIQASLGYFINPLVNIVLGMVFLHERLSRPAAVAVALAVIGVAAQTIMIGSLPVIALVLAFSFGLYGLLRKTARVGSVVGLTIETALLTPFCIGYLIWAHRAGRMSFASGDLHLDLLLIAAGIITTAPLLLFTAAARLLPLSTMGFLQYVAPSGHFLLAVFAFGEPFTTAHLVTFACIWTALAIFTRDQLRMVRTPA